MIPVINATASHTLPPTIVATAIPGNNTVRVPPANVSPPVSSVEINNNARGNNTQVANPAPAPAQPAYAGNGFSSFISLGGGAPGTLSLNAQTTFFTQLLAQDYSAQAKSFLSEYQSLVAIAQVKYKPSNASLPEPEPSGVFGKLLSDQQQIRSVNQSAGQQLANASVATQAATNTPARATVLLAKTASASSDAAPDTAEADSSEEPQQISAPAPIKPRAIIAYLAAVSRNDVAIKPSPELI